VTPASPVPRQVTDELDRLVRRWQQLPLDRAVAALADVRAVVVDLAGEQVPDHGPEVVMDQLRFMVYDRCRDGVPPADLAGRLADLRRRIP
jgi:hypothetical protein